MATNNERKATIIGISGCSSSGKTTLSRLLRDIFPHTYILHEDDFYKAEQESVTPTPPYFPFPSSTPPTSAPTPLQPPSLRSHANLTSTLQSSLPLTPNGNLDWDCAAALDLPALVSALDHIHAHGALPASLVSKEDQNPTQDAHVPASTIARLRETVADWLASSSPYPPSSSSPNPGSPRSPPISATHPLILLDGFLLYPPSVASVRSRLDVRLFLTARYEDVLRRRKSRGGYVTLEGWWEDPEGYVEEVVWGNYVRDHGFMFVRGDVQGGVDEEVVGGLGVRVCPERGMGMEGVVEWAVGEVMEGLERGGRGVGGG